MAVNPGGRIPLKLRAGVDVPSLLGMIRQGTAGSIPDAAFHHLENVRFAGPKIVSRPGQQKATNVVTGPIEGMCDTSDIGAAAIEEPFDPMGRYVYFTGISSSDGRTRGIFRFDSVGLTLDAVQVSPLYDGVTPYYVVFGMVKGLDNNIYIPGGLYDPVGLRTNPGVWRVDPVAGTLTEKFSLGYTATPEGDGGFIIFSLAEDPNSQGNFYAGRVGQIYPDSSPAPGDVWRAGVLDDTASYVNADGAVTYPAIVAFNSTFYSIWGARAALGSRSDTIRKRSGAASWSNLTMPTPPLNYDHYQPQDRPVVYGGHLYIAGVYRRMPAGPNTRIAILSVSPGDVVTIQRTIGAALNTNGMQSLTVFNGKLYYQWRDTSISLYIQLGKFDGAIWTDIEWNGLIGGTQYDLVDLSPNVGDGTSLYGIAVSATGPYEEWVIKSNGTDTTTWTKVVKNTTGYNIAYADMVAQD